MTALRFSADCKIPGGPYLNVYATSRFGIEIIHYADGQEMGTTVPWSELGVDYVHFMAYDKREAKEERT